MIDKIEASQWKPSILVLENSPYLLVGENGMWFQHIENRLNDLGFWFSKHNAIQIDANKNCGLPRRRERLFLFACNKKDFDFNWLNFIPEEVALEPIVKFLQKPKIQRIFTIWALKISTAKCLQK